METEKKMEMKEKFFYIDLPLKWFRDRILSLRT